MIDLHSHILPHFDDGAANTEVSLAMLKESKKQGIERVVSTSHCYPRSKNSINDFIYDRTEKLISLRRAAEESDEPMPMIYSGCELNLSRDISDDPHLRELCIEGTDYLLIEMPYEAWSDWCFESVYKISLRGIKPIMAHIDRFLYQKQEALASLFELDVIYQINAEAFLNRSMKKKIDSLIESGRAHVIGSDMHNLENRSPNIGMAKEKILKNYGQSYWDYFEHNNACILNNEDIAWNAHKHLEKKSFFGRIFG